MSVIQCSKCGLPKFNGPASYCGAQCKCDFMGGFCIKANEDSHMCNCIGPQNGQPRCPCQMRGVAIKDGRYVIPEQDLGAAPISTTTEPKK